MQEKTVKGLLKDCKMQLTALKSLPLKYPRVASSLEISQLAWTHLIRAPPYAKLHWGASRPKAF
jgi:hypothetical protein